MRKHPLLAFAVTTLGLSLGASLSGAVGTAASASTQQTKRSNHVIHRGLSRHVSHLGSSPHRVVLINSNSAVRFVLPSSVLSLPATHSTTIGNVWSMLRSCESGNNYRDNSGNGFYGAYQFTSSSWLLVGERGRPDLATPSAQDEAAKRLLARQGWKAWPTCTWALGLA